MRIALLSHSYHQLTGSADFLAELLRKLGNVETYFDESWIPRQAPWVAKFQPRSFDCIVILQAHECFQYVNPDHPNIVFVPMYDAMIWQGQFFWREVFNCAKVLCFSTALSMEVSVRNPTSVCFQYYPDPGQYPKVGDYSAPRGYYWRRRREINSSLIERITRGVKFQHFTLHDVPDPGGFVEVETHRPRVDTASYEVTGWNVSEGFHLAHLSTHNIYFAPRIREGIGFGFLKAMSMGLCVVAPDTATHNEYIAQGLTGILYQPDKPGDLDLHRYREIGCRARDSMERGHRRWEANSDKVLDFLGTPTSAFRRQQFAVDSWIDSFDNGRHQMSASSRTASALDSSHPKKFPSVAVVTVCLNARNDIEKTIRSVTGQNYPNLEYVICDGTSTDGTIDVIRKYEQALAFWKSRPDNGVYPAMQQSLDHVKSHWVLFMNAGDCFVSADALRRLFVSAPENTDVIYGHHIYRHINGIDELRLASDFEWMWSRLQEGQFNVEYPVGFPAHQATAVRTRLLQKLKFDPLYRIAADHDLLWRAWRSGAKFFHADETISVYVGGGFSARQFARCKQEWCIIALRYGPRRGDVQFQNCQPADASAAIELDYGHRSQLLIQRMGNTALGRMPGFQTLTRTLQRLYIQAAKKLFLTSSGSPPTTLIRFTRDLSTFLSEARGLAEPEDWGTWSAGRLVELVFRGPLPDPFALVLRACAFGPNAGAVVSVTVGAVTCQIALKGRRIREYRLHFNGHGGDNTMVFAIPYPVAPAELRPSESSDIRRIGLGFVSIRILPGPPWSS